MSLDRYRAKRDFAATPEPEGQVAQSGRQRFVVQEHHASRLHYDFRLEMGGVLKSWALPKGPSLNPRERRLAMAVEDHPLEYLDFEGHIPEGSYGAGEVLIWDRGDYEALEAGDPLAALDAGRLKFRLSGRQLKGQFNLIKLSGREDQWLLIKAKDEFADTDWKLEPLRAAPRAERGTASPAQGRQAKRRPNGTRRGAKVSPAPAAARAAPEAPSWAPAGAAQAPLPGFLLPMLATLVDKPFDDPDWLFEIKWDGVRSLAYLDAGRLKLVSRNEKDMSFRYPELAGLPAAVEARQAVLDGEIVALDEDGRSTFQRLQSRVGLQEPGEINRLAREQPVVYMAFDLLYLDGYDLRAVPLHQRKALLRQRLKANQRLRYSDHVAGQGRVCHEQVQRLGLEGIIAKRLDSPYVSGRAGDWLKVKAVMHQEVVVGGYTDPRGTRAYFGALVAGLYRGSELVYVGHVGGGFDQASLRRIYGLLQPLRTEAAPFAQIPATNEAVHWVRPRLVAEVKFANWTADMCLRQPIFLGLRDDKDPRQCTLEEARPVARQVAQAEAAHGGGQAGSDDHTPVAASRAFSRKLLAGSLRVKTRNHVVELTHLDKAYWPDEGYTKADLLRYYWQVASYMLPYLKERPLILKRHPNGLAGPAFFQHDVDDVPDFVQTATLEAENGRLIDYVLCNNRATLLYLANLGTIAQNPWHSRVNRLDCPDWMVFDLDPGEVEFGMVCDLGLAVKDVLDRLGLDACAKTSGSRGLHIYVPLQPVYTYDQVAPLAERIARLVVQENPRAATLERSKQRRPEGAIYVDHLQNARGKTVAAPYAVRARPGATVSAPLTWREVRSHVSPHDFTLTTVPRRLSRRGELFAPVLSKKQRLERALARLADAAR